MTTSVEGDVVVRTSGEAAGTVAHVSQVTDIGGLTHVVADLMRLQLAAGWRVVLLSPPGHLRDLALHDGVEVQGWPAHRGPGRDLPTEMATLRRALRAARPDLVHLHSSEAGLTGRLVLRGRTPTVFSPHAWSFHAVDGPARPAAAAWERMAARWTDVVLCVSERERAEGLAAGVGGRLEVVPNAVDLSRVVGAELRRPAARAALGVPPDAPLVVCVGRLCRQKGQDVLLRAWPAVVARRPGARLVLVGDGPDRAEAEALAAGLPGVQVLGTLDRPTSVTWAAAADVVALPSRWEGMSVTVLEAQALGVPVVGSDVAGVDEALRPGGGRLVPADDPAALGRALGDELLAAPGGAPAVVDGAALHGTASRVDALYRQLLGRRAAGRRHGAATAPRGRGALAATGRG